MFSEFSQLFHKQISLLLEFGHLLSIKNGKHNGWGLKVHILITIKHFHSDPFFCRGEFLGSHHLYYITRFAEFLPTNSLKMYFKHPI